MARKIRFKRGEEARLPRLDVAEMAFTTDTEKPFIGGNSGNLELAKKSDVDVVKTQLADKASKNEVRVNTNVIPINVSEMDTETKKLFTGGAVAVVGERVVGSENLKPLAVGPKKTSFLEIGKNKFDGTFLDGIASSLTGDNVIISTSQDRYCAVMEIEDGKTYTVTKNVGGNRFNVLLISEYPHKAKLPMSTLYSFLGQQRSIAQSHTVTNSYGARYLVVQTNSGVPDIPLLQVEEGNVATEYEPYEILMPELSKKSIPTILQRSLKNIFNGEFVEAWLTRSTTVTPPNIYVSANNASNNGRMAVIPIEPNGQYTISFPEKGKHNRFVIGLANSYPNIGYILDTKIYEGYTDIFDPELTEYTFQNTNEGKYVVIYVSNEGVEPKLQVEKGSKKTEYEPFEYVPKRYLSIIQNDEPAVKNIKKYMFSGELIGEYKSEDVDIFSKATTKHNDVYAAFDSYVDLYPDYISKELLGNDEGGKPLYKYEFIPHKYLTTEPYRLLKIIITSGIHGNEKGPVHSLFNFLKKICDDWREDKILEFMRFNVHFVVVPIVNPSGFDLNQRVNLNKKDLNRDFPLDNDFSGKQLSTQYLGDVINDNLDAGLFVDFHNMYFRDGYMGYAFVNNEEVSLSVVNTIATLGRTWQRKYDFFPQSESHKFGYTEPMVNTMMAAFAERRGLKSGLLEIVRQIDWQTNGSEYDELTVKCGEDLLVNTLKALIKTLPHVTT